jgi:hypothetical protein
VRWLAAIACLVGACAPRPAAEPPGEVPVLELAATSGWISPALAARRESGTTSDDDEAVLRALEEQRVHPIEGLVIDSASAVRGLFDAGALPGDAPVYLRLEGERPRPIAWVDGGEVVERSTGYRLNVRNGPGVGLRRGPAGEALYTYGFAFYPRWRRVFPEPGVALLEAFYSTGVEHIRRGLAGYQTVARPEHSGGDLNLVEWDEAILAKMSAWGQALPAAPMFQLPPSGAVDVRAERLPQSLATGRVVIDEGGVTAYLESDEARSHFSVLPSREDVVAVVSAPFRRPELFSDLDRAVLLGAIDDGVEPLRIIIDPSIAPGYFVPDSGAKTILISPSEVSLNFSYNGLIFSKLPHEAQHVLTFRAHRFLAERCWPEEDDMLETMNYLMEFMWWVQSYPNDAPHWDWEPINSGLVLARMLRGYFPNNRC